MEDSAADPTGPAALLRDRIRVGTRADEAVLVRDLAEHAALSQAARSAIAGAAAELVGELRTGRSPTLLESLLTAFRLDSPEGLALMRLAEALPRIPDNATRDAMIADILRQGNWGQRTGARRAYLASALRTALAVSSTLLAPGPTPGPFRRGIRGMAQPLSRAGFNIAMRSLGNQFVFATDLPGAFRRAGALEQRGYTLSYDMLGEAARTTADATRYMQDYTRLLHAIRAQPRGADFRANPGISVKLSALHPRYEALQHEQAIPVLAERLTELCRMAAALEIGLNVDAEEAERLELSLAIFEQVIARPELAGWEGFGVVVQAYGRRALPVIAWVEDCARRYRRRLMVRLVKGAYWDTEIKRAQVLGLESFPVFTRKANTDISYLACARSLLGMKDWIYPQFGTHNAHTASAILQMASPEQDFEFQRIHGMGATLHDRLIERNRVRCRVYAPIGSREDLLAYLVRRILENGANSSFVSQLADPHISPAQIGQDPLARLPAEHALVANPRIARPGDIFGAERRNAQGWDLADPRDLEALKAARAPYAECQWTAAPTGAAVPGPAAERPIHNPAHPTEMVGTVADAPPESIGNAFASAGQAQRRWDARPVAERARILGQIAERLEANTGELMALLVREAGKNLPDCVGEIREAVDFCRYYAAEARRLGRNGTTAGRGVVVCISPWNFPVAIFTGQIVGALVAGNAVLAKPAEQTTLVAFALVALMHDAGVPQEVLQLIPGGGETVGARLVSDPGLAAVCFTGSTETARAIHRCMARNAPPTAPLIAETGGLNAMIVDSTALPEQTVPEILASAFQSAGQRCSALRILYLQEEVEEELLQMLAGAMNTLRLGDPWDPATDVGPLIDAGAQRDVRTYINAQRENGRVLHQLEAPGDGCFVAPCLVRVSGIAEVPREVFGPVLHVARYNAAHLDEVVEAINQRGFGLTLAVHSRIEARVARIVGAAKVGNAYVNRNQIGAVVGSQPFGGEGLSGTGPKAGGPHFVESLQSPGEHTLRAVNPPTKPATTAALQAAIDGLRRRSVEREAIDRLRERLRNVLAGDDDPNIAAAYGVQIGSEDLPGPTGERNQLRRYPRGVFVAVGAPDAPAALRQAAPMLATGNSVVAVCEGADALNRIAVTNTLPLRGIAGAPPRPETVTELTGIAGICAWCGDAQLREFRIALAAREGALLPLFAGAVPVHCLVHERCCCTDTTAAGGNASLMMAAEPAPAGAGAGQPDCVP